MYTGLRFKGQVKEWFRKDFEKIALEGRWKESQHLIFSEFGESSFRSDFIPCGALVYMPEEWENDKDFETTWNKETGYWTFQCSLKNYRNEIENFMEMVPIFVEKLDYLEYRYEEWGDGKRFYLEDNRLVGGFLGMNEESLIDKVSEERFTPMQYRKALRYSLNFLSIEIESIKKTLNSDFYADGKHPDMKNQLQRRHDELVEDYAMFYEIETKGVR